MLLCTVTGADVAAAVDCTTTAAIVHNRPAGGGRARRLIKWQKDAEKGNKSREWLKEKKQYLPTNVNI